MVQIFFENYVSQENWSRRDQEKNVHESVHFVWNGWKKINEDCRMKIEELGESKKGEGS